MELGRCIRTVQADDIDFLTPVSELQQDSILGNLFHGEEDEAQGEDDDDDSDNDNDADRGTMRKSHKDLHQAAMNLADLVGGKGTKSSETLKSR